MKLCEPQRCTACRSCCQACPTNALSLCLQPDGRLLAQIDAEKCVECGRCEKSCPVLHPVARQEVQAVYAAWSSTAEDAACCSSGGVASVLARKVLDGHGAVYGAAFQHGAVRHIAVTQASQLSLLQGSKYVYSDPSDCFRQADERLRQGQTVLFISTPCQIAGLKRYLNREDERLITAELICHGAPPFAYLKQHLDASVGKGRWDCAAFRGVHDYALSVFHNGACVYQEPASYDLYYHAFLKGLILNEACYSCPYAGVQRTADISLGDFWGIDRQTLQHAYHGKISLVLIHSQRGKALFDACRSRLVFEERTLKEAVAGQETLQSAPQRPADRERFLARYPRKGFDAAVRRTGPGRQVQKLRLKRRLVTHPAAAPVLHVYRKIRKR